MLFHLLMYLCNQCQNNNKSMKILITDLTTLVYDEIYCATVTETGVHT